MASWVRWGSVRRSCGYQLSSVPDVLAGLFGRLVATPGVSPKGSSPVQKFERFVGLLLLGVAALGAVLMGLSAIAIFGTRTVDRPRP